MHPQFAFKRLTGLKSGRMLSRCQFIWQCVLVLAALALALASAETSLGADGPLTAKSSAPSSIRLSPRHQVCVDSLGGKQFDEADAFMETLHFKSSIRVKLLNAVLDQRERLVRQDLAQAKRYISCLTKPEKTPVCQETFRQMKSLNEKAQMARLLLGASQSQYQWSTWRGRARHDLNESLSSLGSYKFKNWQPLTFSERGLVDEALRTIESDLNSQYPRADQASLRERLLIEARYSFFVDYLQIMGQSSLLQWVTDSKVGSVQFKSALEEAVRVSERDLSQIKGARNLISINASRLESNPRLNTPVLYTGIVKSFSMRNEGVCWAMLKMRDEMTDAQTRDQLVMLAATLPLMFIPGPGSFIALTVVGALYVAQSQTQYMATQARELGTTFMNWDEINLKGLRDAKRSRDIDAISVVLGLPLLKSGKMILKVSASTVRRMNWNRSVVLASLLAVKSSSNQGKR